MFKLGINVVDNMELMNWLELNFAGQTSIIKAKIITLCWSIWRSRNDLIWSNMRWPVMRMVAKAWEYLSQWNVAQTRGTGVPIKPPVEGNGAIYWAKPQYNEIKITVDATIFEDRGASGFGIIVRNYEGHLILAKSKSRSEVMNPTLAEALAIKEALSWAKEMDWNTIILESVCLVVI